MLYSRGDLCKARGDLCNARGDSCIENPKEHSSGQHRATSATQDVSRELFASSSDGGPGSSEPHTSKAERGDKNLEQGARLMEVSGLHVGFGSVQFPKSLNEDIV